MEEMIDKDLIRTLRSDKGWSQEHLAMVAGVSLRTVQRIENEGRCSLDSRKALASALEMDAAQLSPHSNNNPLSKDDSRLKAAISWLKSVDSGDYSSSWEKAAPVFQKSISNEKWVHSLSETRMPLGEAMSRSVQAASGHNSLPGAPDGEYIVVSLATSFEHKKSALETVTLTKTSDTWSVAGYFIK